MGLLNGYTCSEDYKTCPTKQDLDQIKSWYVVCRDCGLRLMKEQGMFNF